MSQSYSPIHLTLSFLSCVQSLLSTNVSLFCPVNYQYHVTRILVYGLIFDIFLFLTNFTLYDRLQFHPHQIWFYPHYFYLFMCFSKDFVLGVKCRFAIYVVYLLCTHVLVYTSWFSLQEIFLSLVSVLWELLSLRTSKCVKQAVITIWAYINMSYCAKSKRKSEESSINPSEFWKALSFPQIWLPACDPTMPQHLPTLGLVRVLCQST